MTKLRKISLFAMLSVLSVLMLGTLMFSIFSACASNNETVKTEQPDMPVVSYIRTWPIGSEPKDMDAGLYWSASDIRGDLVSTLNIAFGLINEKDGYKIYIKDLEDKPAESIEHAGKIVPAFSTLFDEVAALKKQYPHLKVNLSVGGWGADGFSDVAADPVLRKNFIEDAANWIEKYGLDGFDVDWEYPVGPSWGQEIKSRPEDADNFISLIKELRENFDVLGKKLGRYLTVTAAVPASSWYPNAIDVAEAQNYLDYMKLMTYDLYGAWSATTGHASNLYNNPNDPEWGGWSVDQTVRMYLDAGVKPEKLLLGVPFYARAWGGVGKGEKEWNEKLPGLFNTYKNPLYGDGLNYMDIESKILTDPAFKYYWDPVAHAAYLYNGDVFITYEDEKALKDKVAYVKEKGLAGIMIWEYAHDMNEVLFEALNNAINTGK